MTPTPTYSSRTSFETPILGESEPAGREPTIRGRRFQFTIGRLLALVALAAVLASVFAQFNWMIGLACSVAAVGFLMDRVKGRSGIVGAIMFGTLGFAAFGLGVYIFESYHGQHMLSELPSTYVLLSGSLGLISGMIVGFGGWAVVVLFRLACEAWAVLVRLETGQGNKGIPGDRSGGPDP